MKSKLAIVAAGCLSLAGYVLAQGHGDRPGSVPDSTSGMTNMSSQGQLSSQSGRTTAQNHLNASASPKPTPRGHHYGWQKGKHNPHHSPTPMPTP
ncbi:MAG: hypothetical protein QOH24_473 [Verrucomicrobiota bacterium]|jgi:hypothetical protein